MAGRDSEEVTGVTLHGLSDTGVRKGSGQSWVLVSEVGLLSESYRGANDTRYGLNPEHGLYESLRVKGRSKGTEHRGSLRI